MRISIIFSLLLFVSCGGAAVKKYENQKGEINRVYLDGYGAHGSKWENERGSFEGTHWGTFKMGQERGYIGWTHIGNGNNYFCTKAKSGNFDLGIAERIRSLGSDITDPVDEYALIYDPGDYASLCYLPLPSTGNYPVLMRERNRYTKKNRRNDKPSYRTYNHTPTEYLAFDPPNTVLMHFRWNRNMAYLLVDPYNPDTPTSLKLFQNQDRRLIEVIDNKSSKVMYRVHVPYKVYPLRDPDFIVDVEHFTRFKYSRDMTNEEFVQQIKEQGYKPYNDLPDKPMTLEQVKLVLEVPELKFDWRDGAAFERIYNWVPALLSRHLGPLLNDYYVKNDAKLVQKYYKEINFFIGHEKLPQLTRECSDKITSGQSCSPTNGDWWLNLSDSSVSVMQKGKVFNISTVTKNNTLWAGTLKGNKLKGVVVNREGNSLYGEVLLDKIDQLDWEGQCSHPAFGMQPCRFKGGQRIDQSFASYFSQIEGLRRRVAKQEEDSRRNRLTSYSSAKYKRDMEEARRKSARNRRNRQARQQLIQGMANINANLARQNNALRTQNNAMISQAIKANQRKSTFVAYDKPTVSYRTKPAERKKRPMYKKMASNKKPVRIVSMTKESCLKGKLNTWENGQCITNIPWKGGNCYDPNGKLCNKEAQGNSNNGADQKKNSGVALKVNGGAGQSGGANSTEGTTDQIGNQQQENLGPAQAACWVGVHSKEHYCAGPLQILYAGEGDLSDALRMVACESNRLVGVYTGKGKLSGRSVTIYNCGRNLKDYDIDVRSLGYY